MRITSFQGFILKWQIYPTFIFVWLQGWVLVVVFPRFASRVTTLTKLSLGCLHYLCDWSSQACLFVRQLYSRLYISWLVYPGCLFAWGSSQGCLCRWPVFYSTVKVSYLSDKSTPVVCMSNGPPWVVYLGGWSFQGCLFEWLVYLKLSVWVIGLPKGCLFDSNPGCLFE